MQNKKETGFAELKKYQTYSTLSILAVLLCTLGIYSISQNLFSDTQSVKGANTFVFEKVDNSNIVKYSSKSTDLEFSYDSNMFSISEDTDSLVLSTINRNSLFKNASMKVIAGKDINSLYPSLEHISTVNDNGVGTSLFSYKMPSLINNSDDEGYLTVIFKQFPNSRTVYLQVWGYNYKDDINLTKSLNNIIGSSILTEGNTSNSEVLSTTSSLVNQAQILGQASTVRIFSKECNTVKFSAALYNSNIGGKTYEICSAGFGSGFVVNANGYVVTNAHVANSNNLDSLVDGWSTDGKYEEDLITDLADFLTSEYDVLTLSQITEEDMINMVIVFLTKLHDEGYITITDKNREIYIQGQDVFKNDPETAELLDKSSHFKANLVKSNDISSFYESVVLEETYMTEVADLAVLQVDGEFNYPSIPIISTGFSTGQTIYVVGYPGIADDAELISSTEVLSSSVTKGSISAIKPNTNNTFDLIQIDAAIQGGNSGGPIIDENGQVVGVATYSISSDSGNYNYGVSAKELISFLSNVSVEPQVNSMRSTLEDSLSDASLQYYKRSLESLNNILAIQPSLSVTLKPVVDLCEEKIVAGEDKTPMFNTNNKVLMAGLLVLLVILLIVAIIFLAINLKKISSKKKELSKTPNLIT